jgi:hypothetical protein
MLVRQNSKASEHSRREQHRHELSMQERQADTTLREDSMHNRSMFSAW